MSEGSRGRLSPPASSDRWTGTIDDTVGNPDGQDGDGTLRVSPDERKQARQRLEDAIGVDATISDGGAAAKSGNASDFASDSEADLPNGHTVGEYVIEDVLGRGGFGTVYRAIQPVIGKRVAIKVLSRKYSADTEIVSRFVAEARAVNQIRHRHIIDIFSFGQLPDGRQYYVMEYLDGEPLDAYLAKNGPLTLEQALPILRAIARALDAAHAKGVAHRDLKPENVFLARADADDGSGVLFWPKLLDFGIAKLSGSEEAIAHKTHTGVPIGTPYYMSPEQCRGQNVDHRTDIYSFGVVSYRLLTGKFPFDGALVDILHHHMHDEPPPPSSKKPGLPSSIDNAIGWMLRKDPTERPKSVIAAVVALQDDKTPTPMLSGSHGGIEVTDQIPRSTGRRWVAPVIGLVVAAVMAAVIVVIARDRHWWASTEELKATVQPAAVDAAPVVDTAAAVTAVDASTAPARVIVKVTKAPEGTEVLISGSVVGSAPGPVQLPRGDEPVVLTFRAEGFNTLSKTVTPNKDQDLAVDLKRKRVNRPTNPGSGTDDEDVIHVFGKENK